MKITINSYFKENIRDTFSFLLIVGINNHASMSANNSIGCSSEQPSDTDSPPSKRKCVETQKTDRRTDKRRRRSSPRR